MGSIILGNTKVTKQEPQQSELFIFERIGGLGG